MSAAALYASAIIEVDGDGDDDNGFLVASAPVMA